jgi:putative ABC transport system ATP-binding protein
MNIINLENISRVYQVGSEEVHALDGVSLKIDRNEYVAIMGPSGSGKSTLLNMLGALDRPTSGQVLIGGEDLTKVRDLDTFRARTVGFIFQLHNLIPTLTALENVEVPMMGQPIGRGTRKRRAKELLELVGLADRMNHLPNQLSGGQRQRVAIARALANKPKLVLADEPTGDLDTHSGEEVIALMHRLNHELGTTFIAVTHDPSVARKTDRILVMRDGNIVHEHQVGTPFEEDLAAFRRSGLAKAIMNGDEAALAQLEVSERAALRQLLGGTA